MSSLLVVLLFPVATARIATAAEKVGVEASVVGAGELEGLIATADTKAQAEYASASWDAFAAALTTAKEVVAAAGTQEERDTAEVTLRTTMSGLVLLRGLRTMVDDYRARVPSGYTPASWTPFGAALDAAQDVLALPAATGAAVAAAKTALQQAAAGLVTTSTGEFHPITNNSFWVDTAGNPIYSQGGGVFRFGDTYYWYGVRYTGAALYQESPTTRYPGTARFVSIPVYTSTDLVNWTFVRDVATTSTAMAVPAEKGEYFAQMRTLADATWLGRLGVAYNENTGKYVLLVQMQQSFDPDTTKRGSVLFLQGDSPTDDFEYANLQRQIANSPTPGTGDQTIFTDDDGTDYLVFSNASGRARAFLGRLAPSDSLSIEPGVQIGFNAAGREGNAMFRLGDTYYMAASDLHGWNTSVTRVIESLTSNVLGAYSAEYDLAGTQMDYSHVTQTGFFVTVKGTKQDTVIYAGDRWANFAWNGIGYNQWLPITMANGKPLFHSVSHWEFNAVTGEWRTGKDNNYVLNPEYAADRITVAKLTGWENVVDAGSPTAIVSNTTPGAQNSQYGLRIGNAAAFSGGVRQKVTAPAGKYRLTLQANGAGGLEYGRAVVTGAAGERYELDLNRATSGWEQFARGDIVLTGGPVTVEIQARSTGANQSLRVDSLSLVRENLLHGWDAETNYAAGDVVRQDDATWRAGWSTQNQAPGDVDGPWQEIETQADGTAVWKASRIFTAGAVATHDGARFTARWWTRNQPPGDPDGPWSPL